MVYIIIGEGFEEIEAVAPCDILRRGGVAVKYAAVGGNKNVTGSHGISVAADVMFSDVIPSADDTIVIPGGMGGVNSIKSDDNAMKIIKKADKAGALLAAICAGPSVLAQLGLLNGKRITCHPATEDLMDGAICDLENSTITDVKLITGRAPGSAIDFGLAILAHIKGESVEKRIRTELVY